MKIGIAGTGSVGSHLYKALSLVPDNKGLSVELFSSRRLKNEDWTDCDVILIAVSDNAVEEVAANLSKLGSLKPDVIVAHTSGSVPMGTLSPYFNKCGVFYPLQTFSRDVPLIYEEIPVFVEGADVEVVKVLHDIGEEALGKVREADSDARKLLHIGAVFSCNFTNHLWALADDFLKSKGLSFSMLHPLLKATLEKAMNNPPGEVQTGPAVRRDMKVIENHKKILESEPALLNIYDILSDSILSHHEK